MNEPAESEFDLEKLFLPAWAQESPSANKYAGFAGEERRDSRDDDRRGHRGPPRGPSRPGDRPRGQGGGPRPGPRPDGPRGDDRRDRGPRPGPRDGRQDHGPRPEPRPVQPLPQISVSILPDEKGLDSLARQIRVSGRAYPLFDIAQLILDKPERQQVRWDIMKGPDGKPLQTLFLCALDDSLWLSEDEAVTHLLGKNFDMFYKAEKTTIEPPKGTYTFVAQCGMSGAILGPPNYHDYQNKLRKLHAERFSRMPYEAFKARVKIVKDEAVVKKWIEDQSTKTQYIVLNVPEAVTLDSREAVEKHFRETHLANLIKPVESHSMSGPAARQLRSPDLQRLLRAAWEEQRRFPLKLATTLSQQFASRGLQFFKVNRTVTHVSVARPRYLDMDDSPVSQGVRKIVDFINATAKCNRRKLFDAIAPAPVAPPPTAPVAEGATPAPTPEPSPEHAALAGDLHWLIHEGHVIEFANGVLETAKKPVIKPPRPEPKPGTPSAPAESVVAETPAAPTEAAATNSETTPEPPVSEPTAVAPEAAPAPVSVAPAVADAPPAADAAPPAAS